MKDIEVLIAGDYCPIGRHKNLVQNSNFDHLFGETIEIIKGVDYSVVNLECPVTKSNSPILKTGPNLKIDDTKVIKGLKYAGFDLITLANNHIRDFGNQGVMDTIDNISDLDMDHVGAGMNKHHASKPALVTIKNKSIGFLNIAENEFCAATDTNPGAYTVDLIDNYQKIKQAKELCDYLILVYHGGREHFQLPTPGLRKRLKFYCDIGVDGIIVHHPHCFSGYEFYKGKPIVYTIGNFLFDYKTKYQTGTWTEGLLCKLSFGKKIEIELVPFYQGRYENPKITLMRGVDKERALEKIDSLSSILESEELYIQHWKTYLKTQKKRYLSNLFYKNKYVREVFARGYLPILFGNRDFVKLNLNMNRCETHSEIMVEILKDQINE